MSINIDTCWERCGLVVVAAGESSRFGTPKQLAPLAGTPLLIHCLRAFAEIPFADRVLVVPGAWIEDGFFQRLKAEHAELRVYTPVAGGATRAESVLKGIDKVKESCDFVAVHDGARPFPPLEATARCLDALDADGGLDGAVVGREVTDTIKRVERSGEIRYTVARGELRAVETPQVARRAVLLTALRAPGAESATDDMQAIERNGGRTRVELHLGMNIKITRPLDMLVAESLVGRREQE